MKAELSTGKSVNICENHAKLFSYTCSYLSLDEAVKKKKKDKDFAEGMSFADRALRSKMDTTGYWKDHVDLKDRFQMSVFGHATILTEAEFQAERKKNPKLKDIKPHHIYLPTELEVEKEKHYLFRYDPNLNCKGLRWERQLLTTHARNVMPSSKHLYEHQGHDTFNHFMETFVDDYKIGPKVFPLKLLHEFMDYVEHEEEEYEEEGAQAQGSSAVVKVQEPAQKREGVGRSC